MSAVFQSHTGVEATGTLALLVNADPERTLAWRDGRPVTVRAFLADVYALGVRLPVASHVVNLCSDRYQFLLAFCATAVAGQTNLLPTSRAPQAVDDVLQAYPDSYALIDNPPQQAPPRLFVIPAELTADAQTPVVPQLRADQVIAIGFTSGSTGQPSAHAKTWASLCASSACNAALLSGGTNAPNLVATVPAQHMYGLETSILLPLRSAAAIDAGQPFFPADIASALERLPAPRVLITTPVHLRTVLHESVSLPELSAIVSATAPLDAELAACAEKRYQTRVIEVFGSTETCVIAHRRTAHETVWNLYPGIRLRPQPDGTMVEAARLTAPTLLPDVVELLPDARFKLRGRNADLIEIAGKRASLGDLTHRLLSIDGVEDAIVFQIDADAHGVRRLAALVVAPDISEADIRSVLQQVIDPVFIPRPLRKLDALPRNATGKLPRDALLAALKA